MKYASLKRLLLTEIGSFAENKVYYDKMMQTREIYGRVLNGGLQIFVLSLQPCSKMCTYALYFSEEKEKLTCVKKRK